MVHCDVKAKGIVAACKTPNLQLQVRTYRYSKTLYNAGQCSIVGVQDTLDTFDVANRFNAPVSFHGLNIYGIC